MLLAKRSYLEIKIKQAKLIGGYIIESKDFSFGKVYLLNSDFFKEYSNVLNGFSLIQFNSNTSV